MVRPTILTAAVSPGNRARELLDAVNAASQSAQTGWVIFLLLTAYYIIALAGVTDKDLLLNAPIALPILGISIDLDQFFLFAPPLYIFIHFGVLLQHAVMVRKVYAFLDVVDAQELAEAASTGQSAVHPLRYEVSSNFFTQYLAGPPQSGLIRFFLQTIVWGTLVLLPVAVLLAFQIKFLPFHDVTITWAHRIYVLIDVMIVALVGVFLPSPHESFWHALGRGIVTFPGFYAFTALSFIAFLAFSFLVATTPGEVIDRNLANMGPSREIQVFGKDKAESRTVFAPTAYFFEGAVDPATGRSSSLFHRNLIVTDEDLVREKDLAPDDVSFSLRFRDLRYARLDRTDIRQADFTCADVTGAIIDESQGHGARFGCPSEALRQPGVDTGQPAP